MPGFSACESSVLQRGAGGVYGFRGPGRIHQASGEGGEQGIAACRRSAGEAFGRGAGERQKESAGPSAWSGRQGKAAL